MIEKIWLKNYGPFKEAEIRLGPLTVIVGPNASGKTIALEALHRLNRYVQDSLRRRGSLSVEVGLKSSSGSTSWSVNSLSTVERGSRTAIERKAEEKHLPRTILLRLLPEEMRKPSYIDSDEPLLQENGYGLATALAYLKLSNTNEFHLLEKRTRTIVPTFKAMRFKRTRVENSGEQKLYGDELIFDMKGAPDLSPDLISDGTLVTIGLLASTMEYSRRYKDEQKSILFLIDELEHGLHPRALAELVGQLRGLAETMGVQILATSHSPYLLDSLKPEEVRLTGLLDDGSATIRELTDHPDFERWKDEMTPGEFWSTVGEDWIK